MMYTDIIHKEEDFFCILEDDWQAAGGFTAWFNDHKTLVDELLSRHGVLRFRKTGLVSNADFQAFISAIGIQPLNYVDGNSPRTKTSEDIYTSTEYPPDVFISMHNELSYSAYYPGRLFFCCIDPPAGGGGETTILNGSTFLHKLDPGIMGDFAARRIRYIRNLHDGTGVGPSWQDTFETQDRAFVEDFCRKNGISLTWKENGLRLEQVRPTVLEHAGRTVWFNQADQFHPSNNPPEVYEAMKFLYEKDEFPLYVSYEDGSEIPETLFEHVRQVSRAHMIALPWEKQDLMLVDNLAALHGRNPFSGKRQILVSMD